jgi:hypothetical protein
MTVSTTTSRVDYTGNGVTTSFAVPFPFVADDYLVVLRTVISTGVSTTLTLDSVGVDGYSVSGAGGSAGSVSVVTAPTNLQRLSIIQNVPGTQEADFVANDPFPAETFEDALDKLQMQINSLRTGISRSLVLYEGDIDGSGRYNANGNRVSDIADGVEAQDAATVAQLSSIVSSSTPFIQTGAGAVLRTDQDKLREVISVTDFGAIGDGTTDNIDKIDAAIAEAIIRGADLYWPDGIFNVSSGVASFHDLRHLGPGAIRRGSSTFYVDPLASQSNTIFVNPASGGLVKDGLTDFYAFTSLTDAFNALTNYGPSLRGVWVVQLAAGTYEGALFPTGLRSRQELTIQGPDVGGTPNVPTAIIDGTSSSFRKGIAGTNNIRLLIKDVKVQDFAAVDEAGIEFSQFCRIRLNNVHADNCYYGWHFLDWTFYDALGGIIENCTVGIQELFGVVRNFKVATSDAERTLIQNCADYGLKAKELCTGHLDYAKIDNCNNGVFLARCSTANLTNCDIYNNTIGAVCTSGSSIVDVPSVDWGAGTADANTVKFLMRGASSEVVRNGGENVPTTPYVGLTEKKVGFDYAVVAHTGTAVRTTIYAAIYTAKAGDLQAVGGHIRGRVYGVATALAGTCIVELRNAGANVCTVTLPVAAAGAFVIDFNLFVVTAGDSQQHVSEARINGGTIVAAAATRAIPFSSVDQVLQVTATLSNSADTVTFRGAELYTTEA